MTELTALLAVQETIPSMADVMLIHYMAKKVMTSYAGMKGLIFFTVEQAMIL